MIVVTMVRVAEHGRRYYEDVEYPNADRYEVVDGHLVLRGQYVLVGAIAVGSWEKVKAQ